MKITSNTETVSATPEKLFNLLVSFAHADHAPAIPQVSDWTNLEDGFRFTIAGMISGTYTDPPALAYSNSICSKEAPAIGYSTVYPLSMFLRIFTAQIVVLFFCG